MTAPATWWMSATQARVFDLAHALEANIPVSPNHPGFRLALMRRHGDGVREDGGSAANELMVLGGHTGTHIDALCHVSHRGVLFGNREAAATQRGGRFSELGVDALPIFVARGVMLDIAGLVGAVALPPGYEITPADLAAAERRQGTEVRPGDAVLIRSGWGHYWGDPVRFLGLTDGVPGPNEASAQWLADRRVRITGAETTAYEHIAPGLGHSRLPVHRVLLVECGIPIVEMLNLAVLAQHEVYEFLFILAPLKIVGATGSPVRPFALV